MAERTSKKCTRGTMHRVRLAHQGYTEWPLPVLPPTQLPWVPQAQRGPTPKTAQGIRKQRPLGHPWKSGALLLHLLMGKGRHTGKPVPRGYKAHETGNGEETRAGHLAASKGNFLPTPMSQERGPGPQMFLPQPQPGGQARTQPWTSTDPMKSSTSGLEGPSWLVGTHV